MVLGELRALLLDDRGASAEVRVVVGLVLLLGGLHRLRLNAGLGGVVDAARQVAVGVDSDPRSKEPREHESPFPVIVFPGTRLPPFGPRILSGPWS